MATARSLSRFRFYVACGVLLVSSTLVTAQAPRQEAAAQTLSVAGDVKTPLSISPAELKAMPRTSVEVKSEDGRAVKYDGVLVGEILRRAGATLGSDLRGDAMATYVLASASDGYQVLFSLAELDPAFTGSEIIVADTADGKPLSANQGPLRIVSPRDARAARAVRMLQRLDVVRLKKER
jgi:DMSO/TMAO reductase YedYZ molybdopterin-dependent catalytic subunit